MSYHREDELDRMRSRRSRDASGPSRQRSRQPYLEGREGRQNRARRREPAYEDDWYDEDLEDVYIESSPSRRPPRGERAQGRGSGRPARRSGQTQRSGSGRSASHRGFDSRYEDYSGHAGDRRRPAPGRAPKRYPVQRKRRGPGIFRILLLVLAVGVIGRFAWSFFTHQTGVWTVAVFGVDTRDGDVEKNARADVQMLCTIDRSTGEIKLVSVYRDTYMKIDSQGTYHKINEAYFEGGPEQAVKALEENLDITIDNYATFNWKAVAEGINLLGGIDVEITPAEFGLINGFITETVNSTGVGSVQLTGPGMQHLDGVQAVAYARIRKIDTDFQRTERQRTVLKLAMEKAKAADLGTLTTLVQAVLPQLSTDIGMDDLLPLAKNIKNFHLGDTAGFPFSKETSYIGRMDCVIPTTLESNVVQLHQFLYGDQSYSAPSSVKKISGKIAEDSGFHEAGTADPVPDSNVSGGSSKGQASEPAAPAVTTAAPETTGAETTEEETTEQETIEASQEESETEDEEEETEEIGPGMTTEAHRPSRPEPSESQEAIGPGVSEPSRETDKAPQRPAHEETSREEATEAAVSQGPGTETVPERTESVQEAPVVGPGAGL